MAGGADETARRTRGIVVHPVPRWRLHGDGAWADRGNPTVIRKCNARRSASDGRRTIGGTAGTTRRAHGKGDVGSTVAARSRFCISPATSAGRRRIGQGEHRAAAGEAEDDNDGEDHPGKTKRLVRCGGHGGLLQFSQPSPRWGPLSVASDGGAPSAQRAERRVESILRSSANMGRWRMMLSNECHPNRFLGSPTETWRCG